MTRRQMERRPRALTCIDCGNRVVWPDGFPGPRGPRCTRCVESPIVPHGPVIHGVECYEAWNEGYDCPHEPGEGEDA